MGDSNNPAPPTGYRWREIQDLPESLSTHADPELDALRAMWRAECEHLDPAAVSVVNQALVREWAIETGIIENVYTLDRGITQTLIERGINAAYIPHDSTNKDPELVARIIQTHADVLEGLFAFVKGDRALTTGYIKELHAALMRYQPTVTVFDQFDQPFETELKRGEYKTLPNSPRTPGGAVHEYCPPEHVASEMDRMVAIHAEHIKRAIPPQVAAAWLHHAFTQIHPFQDGNGRVARAIASLVFIKSGDFPLVVTRDQRTTYIDALEAADNGDLSALVTICSSLQKRALTLAIMKSADTRPIATVDEALDLTRDLLMATGRVTRPEFLKALQTSQRVLEVSSEVLERVRSRLADEVSKQNPRFQFGVTALSVLTDEGMAADSHRHNCDPNPADYLQTISLSFHFGEAASRLRLTLHSVGKRFSGLVVVSAEFRAGDEPSVPICDDIFRITYAEPESSVIERYRIWLDACLIRGLAEWRRTLV